VSTDTWATNRDFAEANGFEFPLLSDWPARASSVAFGVLGSDGAASRRVTFVFDAAGVIRGVIDDPHAEAHARRALATLRALALAPGAEIVGKD
jgi:peroxiredoxin